MSHTAIIKVAPLFTLERFNDPAWTRPGRWLYERLQFLPGQASCPLLCNHDQSREIGVVHDLWRWDLADGLWVVARATVTDAPCWLERGTRASFAFGVVHRRELNIHGIEAEVIARGLVREVSVLCGPKPAEPRAQVLSLERVADPVDEVFYGGGVIRRRNIGQLLGVR